MPAFNQEYFPNVQEIEISRVNNKSVIINFNGGLMSSDAGILLLGEAEEQIGIIRKMVESIPDKRDQSYVKHSLTAMLIQRVGQIACGYEDANDCDDLRNDPIFKILADRYPEIGEALASQPTMSRLENSITHKSLYLIGKAFVDIFIASYHEAPQIIVLDCDDTEDKVYGNQQLSLFNGYYNNYCFMPLHIFEGLSGKLVLSILKPGKRGNGKQTLSIIKRLVSYLREHWKDTIIVFRGDSHFAYPECMDWFEAQKNVMYVTGLTGNAVLKKFVQQHIERAKAMYKGNGTKAKLYHSFSYQAQSWSKSRRVVAKIEFSDKGLNVRYVVTNMEQAKASALYEKTYCPRGEDELFIKEHKLYLKSDRTSCHKFQANQFRLFLHSAAYVLIHGLKINVLKHTEFSNATIQTIRLRLFKIGAKVKELKTKVTIELPSSYPLKEILINSFQMFNNLRQT